MNPLAIFLNRQDRLRSGWRFTLFVAAFYAVSTAMAVLVYATALTLRGRAAADFNELLSGPLGYLLQFVLTFFPALLLGWGFGKFFDGVPRRSLGWTPRAGWVHDLAIGSAVGFGSLLLAAALASALGGFRFAFAPEGFGVAFAKTFFGAAVLYVLLAAAEEVAFRGYPLQTLLRSHTITFAALPGSLLFAAVHLANPNVPRDYRLAFMFGNTALAGVWLAVAYWRTRTLWLPLGIHWAWNWALGSVAGLPVSGITSLNRAPLLRAADAGPEWLTGGSYGIEGGAACTAALILSTVFVWKTRLLRADEELKKFTDAEQPKMGTADAGEVII
ncbi:MAG TPA: type II CAAX endopeptidase family protein [Pyrinomonadaceae bacterium]|nr:type II CAAX endopeptidase family protein [Pyrinomonadaceae bacterium]